MSADLDFIFMGSDGVFDRLNSEEIVTWIYRKMAQSKIRMKLETILSDLLKNECLSPDYKQTNGLGCDNLTGVLIKFQHY